MINLNLLSPMQKEHLKIRVLYSMIERAMILLTAMILIVTIGLNAVKIKLTEVLSGIAERQILSSEYVSANNDIKNLNAGIARVEKVEKSFVPASIFFEDVIRRAPQGVTLSSASFETVTHSIIVSGFADTRDGLLSFESNLRGSPYVDKLDSQLSNLLQRRDISFTLRAVLATDKLIAAFGDGGLPVPPPTAPEPEAAEIPVPPETAATPEPPVTPNP